MYNELEIASGAALENAIANMILSASGWRGIFAANGEEESAEPGIGAAHRTIAAAAAKVFSDYLRAVSPGKNIIIVGRDTRPTGEAIADAVIRVLLSAGREVWYTGVAAAPEIMAYARTAGIGANCGGFIYISASHNPIGHNGIKFGLTDGGVLQASETAKLISAFRELTSSIAETETLKGFHEGAGKDKLTAVYGASTGQKKEALRAYWDFTREVISGGKCETEHEEFFSFVRKGLEKRPMGIAVDFNGSARAASIDREFLLSLGAAFYSINDKEIAHRIVPEGESLEPCRVFIEELNRENSGRAGKSRALNPTIAGYVPDCDGDRGNLVVWDDAQQLARVLEAQEVFALACVAELSSLVWTGQLTYNEQGKAIGKVAIAVNDPTSLRIDRIAKAFGASVFRAEVGEANTVGLARKLREQGYLVRILGEGSSGGTITHPSAVRDPIDTIGAILKLLAIRDGNGEGLRGMGLFKIWLSQREKNLGIAGNQAAKGGDDFSLADIIASLPEFTSTGAYTQDALLRVKTEDHGLLKNRYQTVFLREWDAKKETLKSQFGIDSWEAIAYNGMNERRGIAGFGEAARGGLKIEFFGPNDKEKTDKGREASACIWMRGSGTEPVFRVMADAESPGLERLLIEWQRRMVQEADSL